MSKFRLFARAIADRFTLLSRNKLFETNADSIYQTYLDAFPEGTNPKYITNTEHDCSCCKNFLKHLGGVVAIVDGKVRTLWDDHSQYDYPYNIVAKSLRDHVLAQPILGVFRTKERQYGAETTRQGDITWHHFYGEIAERHFSYTPDKARGDADAIIQVFRRGLEELNVDAIETVLGLIDSNNLYRGEEHLAAVTEFANLLRVYKPLDPKSRELFVFGNYAHWTARFRNTVIGTLVTDLSDGVDLEKAVASFEAKVAPANYKRPTALITPGMVKEAMKTIDSLGIEQSLTRRLATLADVNVNDVIWVDGSVKQLMRGGIADLLTAQIKTPPATGKATDIDIENFMSEVLPKIKNLEVLFKNSQAGNLAVITAPTRDDAPPIFRWDNNFAWSYNGNVTDSIKERVKAAGGNVDAKLRFSLAWYNLDDLDIHVIEPDGSHIYYGNKAGKLDVDMNAFGPRSRTPVENISFKHPKDGIYKLSIQQYNRRETSDVGFTVEIADANGSKQYSYKKAVIDRVIVGSFAVTNGKVGSVSLNPELTEEGISQEVWGLPTEQFSKVQTVVFSPNHWGENAVGNKHWFFILDGCKTDQPMRGIYNEFLRGDLEPHRKVFEILGDKTKCPVTDNHLAGLGFSSTKRDTLTVKADGRPFNINF